MTEQEIYKRRSECDHVGKREIPRLAVAGWWYRQWRCPHCHKGWNEKDRPVDHSSLQDCEAADATQGIV